MDPGVDESSTLASVEGDTGDSGLVEGTKAAPVEVDGAETAGVEGVGWNTAGSGVCGAAEGEEEAAELKGMDCAADAGAADPAAGTAGVWLAGAEAGITDSGRPETTGFAGATAAPPPTSTEDADRAEAAEGVSTPVSTAAPAPSWASRWLTAEARALKELLGCAVGTVCVLVVGASKMARSAWCS